MWCFLQINITPVQSKLELSAGLSVDWVHTSTVQLIKMDHQAMYGAEVLIRKKVESTEGHIGISYSRYNSTVDNYSVSFGCDLLPNGEADMYNSYSEYRSKYRCVGIPLGVIRLVKNTNDKLKYRIGMQPIIPIGTRITPFYIECSDPTLPTIEYTSGKTNTVVMVEVGLRCIPFKFDGFRIYFEPEATVGLNKMKIGGVVPFANSSRSRIWTFGLQVGVDF